MFAPVPPAGDHEYVVAPLAVNETVEAAQTVAFTAEAVIVGVFATVVTELEIKHVASKL
mgnify:CR=1 FL=1